MRILYFGDDGTHSTSLQRALALRRIGHEVTVLNPRSPIPRGRVFAGLNVRTGFRLFAPLVLRWIRRRLGEARWDLAWMDGCPEMGRAAYRDVRRHVGRIINYNLDDPFGTRDRRKWDLYLQAVPEHDVTVVVRTENIAEARARGARRVVRVFRSYDPVAHAPIDPVSPELDTWRSEVVFVGTWMPERGPFFAELLRRGLPVVIRGDLWAKAAEIDALRPALRGAAVYGRDYVRALCGAKIALGLLSKGNRDLHTQRSAEVPHLGVAFCAERTTEHVAMLGEDGAALFDNAEECVARCRRLLDDPAARRAQAERARDRIHTLRLSNDEVLAGILGEGPEPWRGA